MNTPITIEISKQKQLKRDLAAKIPKWIFLVGYAVASIGAIVLPQALGSKTSINPMIAGCIFVIIMLIWSIMALQRKIDALVQIIGEDEINNKLVSRMKHAADIDIQKMA